MPNPTISESEGPYLDTPTATWLTWLLGNSPTQDIDLSNKADKDINGKVPLDQIPYNFSGLPDTLPIRGDNGEIKIGASLAADDAVRYDVFIAGVTAAVGVLPRVVDLRLTANVGTSAVADISGAAVAIPGLDIPNVRSGDRWKIAYKLLTESSQAGGITVRFKAGAGFVVASDYTIEGTWKGTTTVAAPVNNNTSREESVVYPTAHPAGGGNNLAGSFGGLGVGVAAKSWVEGFFEITLAAGAILADTISIEFGQRVTDAVPTRILAGSKLTAAMIA